MEMVRTKKILILTKKYTKFKWYWIKYQAIPSPGPLKLHYLTITLRLHHTSRGKNIFWNIFPRYCRDHSTFWQNACRNPFKKVLWFLSNHFTSSQFIRTTYFFEETPFKTWHSATLNIRSNKKRTSSLGLSWWLNALHAEFLLKKTLRLQNPLVEKQIRLCFKYTWLLDFRHVWIAHVVPFAGWCLRFTLSSFRTVCNPLRLILRQKVPPVRIILQFRSYLDVCDVMSSVDRTTMFHNAIQGIENFTLALLESWEVLRSFRTEWRYIQKYGEVHLFPHFGWTEEGNLLRNRPFRTYCLLPFGRTKNYIQLSWIIHSNFQIKPGKLQSARRNKR